MWILEEINDSDLNVLKRFKFSFLGIIKHFGSNALHTYSYNRSRSDKDPVYFQLKGLDRIYIVAESDAGPKSGGYSGPGYLTINYNPRHIKVHHGKIGYSFPTLHEVFNSFCTILRIFGLN